MTDWRAWHAKYDDPAHPLAQRLLIVRETLARTLTIRRGEPTTLMSMCAGDGRDTLPVLAAGFADVAAVLVELDSDLADTARREAARLGLTHIEVRTGDAGDLATYRGMPPADVLLACGLFGNISDRDVEETIARLPGLMSSDARIIWTRGVAERQDPTTSAGDPTEVVREALERNGFQEETLLRPDGYRVGVHRFVGEPVELPTAGRMFQFVR